MRHLNTHFTERFHSHTPQTHSTDSVIYDIICISGGLSTQGRGAKGEETNTVMGEKELIGGFLK